jgi:hypothetical protein
MALSHSRRDSGMNYWPGFVDALSTLILSVIFLLTVFMVAQFFLSQEVSGKNTALARLTAQISRLSELLSLEKTGKANLEEQVAQLRASLSAAEGERERFRAAIEAAQNDQAGKADAGKLSSQLDLEKEATARAVAQIEILNTQISALRRQIAALEEALGASEKKEKESQLRIADLGQRLNVALAQRVQELSRYRSDFFGKLREILGNRPDVRVVGDRFVFQSEVFFDSGPPCGAAKVALNSTSSLPLCSTSIRRFPLSSTGCCASMAIPTHGRLPPRRSNRIGSCPPRVRFRSCNIWSAKVSRRSGWWRQALASSSRSIPATPRKPSAAIAESS